MRWRCRSSSLRSHLAHRNASQSCFQATVRSKSRSEVVTRNHYLKILVSLTLVFVPFNAAPLLLRAGTCAGAHQYMILYITRGMFNAGRGHSETMRHTSCCQALTILPSAAPQGVKLECDAWEYKLNLGFASPIIVQDPSSRPLRKHAIPSRPSPPVHTPHKGHAACGNR